MTTPLDDFVKSMHDLAHETVSTGFAVFPTLIFKSADSDYQDTVLLLDELPSDYGPDAVRVLTYNAIRNDRVAAVVFMTEAWTVQRRVGQEPLAGRVADEPDREEAVVCTVTTRAGTALYSWPIRRPEGSAPSVEWHPAMDGELGGRLIPERDGPGLN